MFQFLVKKRIKNYDNYEDNKVREAYGALCSYLSICCNVILVIFKFSMGMITHSIAIQADALNNLSDVGSNIASLFGFKLANKHPDEDHPYGHGRYEYISGLVISFLILLVGIQSLKDSIMKIIIPEEISFSITAVIILVVSIGIKLWMRSFNLKAANFIHSTALKAASQDSLNDAFTTLSSLFALCMSTVVSFPIDGMVGTIVSIIVLKAGIYIFKETVNPLLGMAPDKELIKEIQAFILSYDEVLGIHDIIMHDYGPSRRFLSLHVEVDGNEDIMIVHDAIDLIERDVLQKYHILTTIHMDPIDQNDALTNELKEEVLEIVLNISKDYSIHDFRIVSGPTHTNLVFDVLVPSSDTTKHRKLKDEISKKVKEKHPNYECVIQIDHLLV